MTEQELLQEALEWREHIAKLSADYSDQELFREKSIGGDEMSDLLQEIKDYLDSIRHNAVRAALAKNVNEYGVCVKIVSDCEEAVLSLFRKLDREYWELREQFEQMQAKAERYKEIVNLFKTAFENGDAEHRTINGRSVQAMALIEEMEGGEE